MRKVYIWGAGHYAEHVYNMISRETCVIEGMIDLNQEKQGMLWNNTLMIYSPDDLLKLEYDYVILSMIKYESAESQCKELGIPDEKVIIYWKNPESDGVFKSRSLAILEEQRKRKIYENRLDSAPYEWGLKRVPQIEPSEILLNKMIRDKSSLCRFGDGEFEIMRGNNRPWFQSNSETLRTRLLEVINSKSECINIAIAQNFINLEALKEEAADDIRDYMAFQTREDILKMLDMDRVYYDTYVTRPYIIYRDKRNADIIFPLFKKLWKNRSLLIIEGKYARNGVNNDLFDSADSIRRIVCPSKNAWSKYDEIKKSVLDAAKKQDLICISLGPTATVLAYDLANMGFQSVDIGQIDNEYEWYLMGAKERTPIEGKMVAEVENNRTIEAFYNQIYYSEIISIID